MVGYTSIEQAKKLIEIGIDTNTADMHYFPNIKIPGVLSYSQMLEHFNKKQSELNDSSINTDAPDLIPCSSTEALLKILPIETNGYIMRDIHSSIKRKYKIAYSYRGDYDEFAIIRDTLCECAYETILKLKELKLI